MTPSRSPRCQGTCGMGLDKPHPQASGYCLPCGERYLAETLAVVRYDTGQTVRVPKKAVFWGLPVPGLTLRAGLLNAEPGLSDVAYWRKPGAKFGIRVGVLPQIPTVGGIGAEKEARP